MNVREFIEQLSKLPPDLPVVVMPTDFRGMLDCGFEPELLEWDADPTASEFPQGCIEVATKEPDP